MKAVVLAGGKGTRISEETRNIPKPMICVGNKPILHHIIDEYVSWGINEIIILTGYKSEIIYGYFLGTSKLVSHGSSFTTFQLDECKIILVPSGINTMTGGRLKSAEFLIDDDFFFTYGDGLSDISIDKVMKRHKEVGSVATISGVRPLPRFGSLTFNADGKILDFGEKQEHLSGWINGGFSVLSPKIFSYIHTNDCNLEKDVYPKLASQGHMYVVTHSGFWQCVDTLRDLEELENIYKEQGAIWIK